MKYPANEAAVPAILQTIENDTDPLVRQKCVWSLFGIGSPDKFREFGADKTLTKLLDAPGEKLNLVRYDAARKLANVLGPDAPDKTADVLLDMLKNKSLKVYNRTDAKVSGSGTEATAGQATVQANLGGDARYMAAEALGWLKGKARARGDVMEALKDASKDEDPKLRKTAEAALKELGG
jgi:HEAT repeat protein